MAQIPGMNMPRTGPPPFRGNAPAPKAKPKMMAGGGFGAPGPFGGGAPPAPDAGPPPPEAAGPADPDMDGDMDSPTVKPESVNYHDDPQSCSQCQYMGDGGQCSVLKMQVSPDGGCNAFESGAPAGADEGMGADTDMDAMGGPPPGGPPPPPPAPGGGSPFGRGR